MWTYISKLSLKSSLLLLLMTFHLSIELMRNLAGHKVLLILHNPGGTCRNIYGCKQLYPLHSSTILLIYFKALCSSRKFGLHRRFIYYIFSAHVIAENVFRMSALRLQVLNDLDTGIPTLLHCCGVCCAIA
jgi:hypothetical protein